MACIAMASVRGAYTVMAYIVVACTVMASVCGAETFPRVHACDVPWAGSVGSQRDVQRLVHRHVYIDMRRTAGLFLFLFSYGLYRYGIYR